MFQLLCCFPLHNVLQLLQNDCARVRDLIELMIFGGLAMADAA